MNYGHRPTTGFARPIGTNPMAGHYHGEELAMAPARLCATDTREFPTRIGNRLHYHGGRVTDMDGQTIHPTAQGT